MGRLKPDTRNLSQGEADTIVSIVKKGNYSAPLWA